MKVIFLDFDGVIHTTRSMVGLKDTIYYDAKKLGCGVDPVAVGLIHRVCKMTGAKVVISSSWRITNDLSEMQTMFCDEFGWSDEIIIDITPIFNDPLPERRGREIQEWINLNTVGDMHFQYVIIDDDSDMLETQLKRFVQVDGADGFLFRDFKKVMELFGNDYFART